MRLVVLGNRVELNDSEYHFLTRSRVSMLEIYKKLSDCYVTYDLLLEVNLRPLTPGFENLYANCNR